MTWILIGGAVWLVAKYRPRRLGDDILKLELFRHLRYKNAQDASLNMTYEEVERRQWLRITAIGFGGSVLTFCVLAIGLKISISWSLPIATIIGILSLMLYVRRSQTFLKITLPLYVTLCRIPNSRWDLRDRPAKWVKVNLEIGKVWIHLPKDWNATPVNLKAIQSLVFSRIPDKWTMQSDTRQFLLTFTREKDAETILLDDTAELPVTDPDSGYVVMDKDTEGEEGPW